MEFTFINKRRPDFKVVVPPQQLARLEKFPYFAVKSRAEFRDYEKVTFELPLDITIEEVKDLIRFDYHYTEKDLSRARELEELQQEIEQVRSRNGFQNNTTCCCPETSFMENIMSHIGSEYQRLRPLISSSLLDFVKKEGLGYEYDDVFDNMDIPCYGRISLGSIEAMKESCEAMNVDVPVGTLDSKIIDKFNSLVEIKRMMDSVKTAIKMLEQKRGCKICNNVERIKELKCLAPNCRSISMAQYILYSYWGLSPDNCKVDFGDIHRTTIEKMESDPICSPHLSEMFLNFLTSLKEGDYLYNLEMLTSNMDIFNKILVVVDPDQFMDIMGVKTKMDRAAFRRNWNSTYFVNRKFR